MTDYLKAEYDLESPELISVIDELPLWAAPFGFKLLEQINYKKNINALDIGFGTGFPLTELAMRLGVTSKVYGIDPWKTGIKRAKKKIEVFGLKNVEIIEGIAEEMPFENNFFDLIVSNNGLNNVNDLSAAVNECRRILREEGQFIFTFNLNNTFNEFYNIYQEVLAENNLSQYADKISDHIYSKRKPVNEVKELLSDSAFKIKNITEYFFIYKFTDGSAMLNHHFIKLAFMDSWKNILPENLQETVFIKIEQKLNEASIINGGISMKVPFVIIDSEKA